ncbi:MAG TPA: hypothetical protein VGR60_07765 [Gemmatimonadales bacterium]|nr:hypothetical protein [Gemmatimonadales bacterium]
MSRASTLVATALVCLAPFHALRAWQGPASDTGQGRLRVFIDCQQTFCDDTYFRTELTWVDHVRTPEDAEVQVLITSQTSGGGGDAYTLVFLGRARFAGRQDTLAYFAPRDNTDEATRKGLLQRIELGLVRYAADSRAADRLHVTYAPPAAGNPPRVPGRDPWDHWVFRVSGSTNLNGQQTSNFTSVGGSVSASRVTDRTKFRLSFNENYNRSAFDFDVVDSTYGDTTIFSHTEHSVSESKYFNGDALMVWSVGGRWSAGGEVTATRSTSLNQTLALRVAPGLEYDLFPYSESAHRLLTFRYQVGVDRYVYDDTTIFDKTRETLLDQTFDVSFNAVQTWGSAGLSIEAAQFLNDLGHNHLSVFGNASVRLVRGLSLNFFGSVASIHDQLYLSRSGLSPVDVYLQRRQLATNYQYSLYTGLSYTFGSIFNNVVNPRFEGGGGGVFFFN